MEDGEGGSPRREGRMLEEPTLLREQVGPYSIGAVRGSFSERSVVPKDLRDRIHYGDQLEETAMRSCYTTRSRWMLDREWSLAVDLPSQKLTLATHENARRYARSRRRESLGTRLALVLVSLSNGE